MIVETSSKKWSGDFCVAITMLLFTGLLIWQIFTIQVDASRMLPGIACILCGISGLALLVKAVRGHRGSRLMFTGCEWIVIAMLLACWTLMEHLGFYTSLYLLLLGVSILMAKDRSGKKLLKIAAANLAFIGIAYLLFAVLLQMITPTGVII